MSKPLAKDDVKFQQRLYRQAGFYDGKLDGIWGPKTDKAFDSWETSYAETALRHGHFDGRTEQNIYTLLPPAQTAARGLLKFLMFDLSRQFPDVRIISGTRTYAEQDRLWYQGRHGHPGRIVTNAMGGRSNHNFGLAWDIGIFRDGKYLGDQKEVPVYVQAGKMVMAEEGLAEVLEWGGNWPGDLGDYPHFQLKTGLKLATIRSRFERGVKFLPSVSEDRA